MPPTWAEVALKFSWSSVGLDKICRLQVLGGVAVAVVSLAAFRQRRRSKVDRFPEVPGWPILEFEPSRGVEIFEEWARKYGSEGVFEVTLMGERFVAVCQMEQMREILALRPFTVTRPSAYRRIGMTQHMTGLFWAEGCSWQTQRRLVAPAFNSKSMKGYAPLVCHIVDSMTKKVSDAAQAGESVNVSRLFQLMNIDVITRVALGVEWGALAGSAEEVEWISAIMDALWKRTNSLVPYWKVPGLDRLVGDKARPSMSKLRRTLTEILDGTCRENTLLAKLVQKVDGEVLSREELIGNLVVLFLAGADTTTHSLAWTMYHLAQQPNLQQELNAEADALAPGPATAEAAAEGADSLVFARAVAAETVRLNGPAPILDLENSEPFTLAGRRVPANTTLFLLSRMATEQCPGAREALGSDLNVFRPSRWILPSGKLVQCSPFNTIQFGYGARQCVGMNLANTVMTLAIAELMRAFRIERWDGPPMLERTTFVQRPAEDIRVRFVART